ncbi:hypothetical protein [Rhizobium sp. BR 315]|uniref:hypothetical protein n=1 Tax=Rhizobium sp. BR 315 TaxID=3040014 RepID=UPI003D33EEBD
MPSGRVDQGSAEAPGTFSCILELTADDEADETCGLFHVEELAGETVDCGPDSSQPGADLDETIRIFINALLIAALEARNEDRTNEMLATKVARLRPESVIHDNNLQ